MYVYWRGKWKKKKRKIKDKKNKKLINKKELMYIWKSGEEKTAYN